MSDADIRIYHILGCPYMHCIHCEDRRKYATAGARRFRASIDRSSMNATDLYAVRATRARPAQNLGGLVEIDTRVSKNVSAHWFLWSFLHRVKKVSYRLHLQNTFLVSVTSIADKRLPFRKFPCARPQAANRHLKRNSAAARMQIGGSTRLERSPGTGSQRGLDELCECSVIKAHVSWLRVY